MGIPVLTVDQAKILGIDIKSFRINAEIETVGAWQIIRKYKALCISSTYSKSKMPPRVDYITIYGKRSRSIPRDAGYHLEGQVSVEGKRYSAFTSSLMVEIEGHTVDIAVIHARVK